MVTEIADSKFAESGQVDSAHHSIGKRMEPLC